LQYLGKISFSLYLLHLIVLGTVGCYLFNHLVWRIGYGEAAIVATGVALPLTFGVSSLYTNYVDLKSIAFSKRVSTYVLGTSRKSRKKPEPVQQRGSKEGYAGSLAISMPASTES
jgi:peptidoglycan/LPS O-acetylase OafA/YrhL